MELFRLFGSVIIDDKKALSSLKNQEKNAKKVSAAYKQFGQDAVNAGKALAAGLAIATTAATALVVKFADVTSEISDNSKKVAMSAEEYQKWTYAAKQSGMEQETLLGLMKRQQTSFANARTGSKKLADAYKKLNIDVSKLTSEQGFEAVIKSLAEMTDETERNAIANVIFGKSYADLTPLLKEGADGIDALRQRAEELGIVISDEAVAAGDKFGDTMDDLKAIFAGIGYQLATELLPYFQQFADWVIAHKEDIKKFTTEVITKLGDALQKVADWIFDIVNDKDKAKEALDTIKNFIVWFTGAALISALATHPIITIVGALATLITFKDQFAELYKNMTPSNRVLTQLGALALAIGGVLVAATMGAAAIPIGVGMAALALALGAVIAKGEESLNAGKTSWKPQSTAEINASSWQYGSNQINPDAYKFKSNETDAISKAVEKGLKNVKIVLDDKQVGAFVNKQVLIGLDK